MVQPDLTDVPNGHPFHDRIFAVARRDVPGCAWDAFCPDAATTRGSMARFLLKAKEGAQYVPPKCMGSAFSDVPCGTEGAIGSTRSIVVELPVAAAVECTALRVQ